MAQHDYIISNQTFPNTRADINNALLAISSNNTGTSAPTTQYAGQFWIDTNTPSTSVWTLYIHDGSDDIPFATIDTSANTVNFSDSALDVVTDTTPQLGGDLDLNSNDITGTGNINITGNLTASGNLTSKGIDDNATNTAVTITSGAAVQIGSTNSGVGGSIDLSIGNTSSTGGITLWSTTTASHSIGFADGYTGTDRYRGYLEYSHSGDSMRFGTSSTERMRIDSSGNLLVGKTASNTATAGIELRATDQVTITRSGNTGLIVNRLSSDGSITKFQKDGTNVGDIGNNGDNLVIDCVSSDHTGLDFANDKLIPRKNSSASDNGVDLGYSGGRFKDLYLSGGAFIGGTGIANKLDDYEEGTFTPTITAGLSSISYSAQIGLYTKIGDFVYVVIRLDASGTANASRVEMGGLPFATKGSPNPGNGLNWSYVPAGVIGSTSTNSPILFVSPGSSLIKWYNTAGGNFVGSDLNNASSLDMYISGSYKV